MPEGEVQAWRPHRTGLADPLGLISLQQGRAGRALGEEELGIAVTAHGAVTPVHRLARGIRQAPHRYLLCQSRRTRQARL
jgi:hypothetical protein